MNHLEVWAMETYESEASRRWSKFYDDAEAALGHSLDNDIICGYSVDEAYDEFLAGKSGKDYAAMVKARPNYNPNGGNHA